MSEHMHRCERCGRPGSRMTPIRNRWVKRIDGYQCRSTAGCIARVRILGKWTGKRVLRRIDADGTQWTIRRYDDLGLRGMTSGPWESGYVLVVEHREHRGTSCHDTPELAKAHVDELVASFRARDIEAYRDEPVVSDEQLELA